MKRYFFLLTKKLISVIHNYISLVYLDYEHNILVVYKYLT